MTFLQSTINSRGRSSYGLITILSLQKSMPTSRRSNRRIISSTNTSTFAMLSSMLSGTLMLDYGASKSETWKRIRWLRIQLNFSSMQVAYSINGSGHRYLDSMTSKENLCILPITRKVISLMGRNSQSSELEAVVCRSWRQFKRKSTPCIIG